MRANCFHVHLPVRIQHGGVVWARAEQDGHVHGHGDLVICIHGVRQRNLLGPIERQDWAEEGAAWRHVRHGIEHASFRLRDQPANGVACPRARRPAERVRSFVALGPDLPLTDMQEHWRPSDYRC